MPTYSSSHLRQLESNIDDMNPEILPYVFEVLFELGARDVWSTPIVMKGGRSAFTLSVLFEPTLEEAITEAVFRETSTLGVRVQDITRHELARELVEVETPVGSLKVKLARSAEGKVLNAAPEYADCRRLAIESSTPLKDVYQMALRALKFDR